MTEPVAMNDVFLVTTWMLPTPAKGDDAEFGSIRSSGVSAGVARGLPAITIGWNKSVGPAAGVARSSRPSTRRCKRADDRPVRSAPLGQSL
jgi:hypothetical protein